MDNLPDSERLEELYALQTADRHKEPLLNSLPSADRLEEPQLNALPSADWLEEYTADNVPKGINYAPGSPDLQVKDGFPQADRFEDAAQSEHQKV